MVWDNTLIPFLNKMKIKFPKNLTYAGAYTDKLKYSLVSIEYQSWKRSSLAILRTHALQRQCRLILPVYLGLQKKYGRLNKN